MLVGSSPRATIAISPQQARTQFSLWSMMAAPLILGGHVLNRPGLPGAATRPPRFPQ